jgi:hypothetical protein
MGDKSECVKVCLRTRPFSKQEIIDKRERCVELDERKGTFRVIKPGAKDERKELIFFFFFFFPLTFFFFSIIKTF